MEMRDKVCRFARVNFRNNRQIFGIKQEDRFSHIYIIGKTGTGKSTLIETMVREDMRNDNGFALIDPHGDLADRVVANAPPDVRSKILYFNPSDPLQPYGYNPLRYVRPELTALAASGLMSTLKKMWPDAWGVRMEHILRNTLMALLEHDGSTLHDVVRLLTDKAYRRSITSNLQNDAVKRFFAKEFEQFSFGYRSDGTAPIQNKIGAFLSDPLLNKLLTKPEADLHIRKIMDDGDMLVVNLAKGRLGEDTSSLLGGLLVSTIAHAAYSRADIEENQRRDFFVYIDEFQNFTTLALINMFSELRKYRIGFTIAHQYIHQLDDEIRHAVLGNSGSLISFRTGAEDAPFIQAEFCGQFRSLDLLNLDNHSVYTRIMVDGKPSKPFSALTLSSPSKLRSTDVIVRFDPAE